MKRASTEKSAELAAVISAAIAAYERDTGAAAGTFAIRKITRVSENLWGKAGIADCMESRRM